MKEQQTMNPNATSGLELADETGGTTRRTDDEDTRTTLWCCDCMWTISQPRGAASRAEAHAADRGHEITETAPETPEPVTDGGTEAGPDPDLESECIDCETVNDHPGERCAECYAEWCKLRSGGVTADGWPIL